MFKLIERKSDDYFTLTVRNGCHFDKVVGNISILKSIIQVARSDQVTRMVNQLFQLTGIWKSTVHMYVQLFTAMNL